MKILLKSFFGRFFGGIFTVYIFINHEEEVAMATYIPISTVDVIEKDFPMSALKGKKVYQVLPIYSEYRIIKSGEALSFTFLLIDKNDKILDKVEDGLDVFHSFSQMQSSRFVKEKIVRVKTFVDFERNTKTNDIIVAICLYLDVPGGCSELDDLCGPIANILRNASSRHTALLITPIFPELHLLYIQNQQKIDREIILMTDIPL